MRRLLAWLGSDSRLLICAPMLVTLTYLSSTYGLFMVESLTASYLRAMKARIEAAIERDLGQS